MKICWDNLENIKLTIHGYFRSIKTGATYIYRDSCKICNNPYLTLSAKTGEFCDYKCSSKYKAIKNPLIGKNNPFYGKRHSEETKKEISIKIKKKFKNKENHPNWKGGVIEKDLPLYDTYAHQIDFVEEVKQNTEDKNILEVKCTYCGKWYVPRRSNVMSRIKSLNGEQNGENRFYCSPECKNECPIYKKVRYSAEENNTKKYSREVQPELRQMVFERDNWECRKCGSNKSLHCHHLTGIELNPIESADIDNCITFCKKCHKWIHKQKGSTYKDMKRKKCKELI